MYRVSADLTSAKDGFGSVFGTAEFREHKCIYNNKSEYRPIGDAIQFCTWCLGTVSVIVVPVLDLALRSE